MAGRKITLHLVDGTPNGIIRGQLGNWIGMVTYGPRTKLDDFRKHSDVRRPGIYVLAGPDPTGKQNRAVYIGESENVYNRITEHERSENKDFFDHLAIITSSNENLTKGHIRYLESKLIQIAHETKRSSVINKTNAELPPLPAADADEMDVFLSNLQMLLPVMGLNFALPKPTRRQTTSPDTMSKTTNDESPIFEMSTSKRGSDQTVTARAQLIDGEFVVFAQSHAFLRDNSISYTDLKGKLIRNGSLDRKDNWYEFTDDVPFSSPSAAASVVAGRNINGRQAWKIESTGATYGEWLDQKLESDSQDLT